MNKIKKVLKIVYCIIIVVGISFINLSQNVNALGVGFSFEETIPDPVVRQTVMLEVGVFDSTEIITQEHIDRVSGPLFFSDPEITSLSGLEYFVNAVTIQVNTFGEPTSISEIPEEISNVSGLTLFHVIDSKLTSLPNSITSFSDLSNVDFSRNNIYSITPEQYNFINGLRFVAITDQTYSRNVDDAIVLKDFTYKGLDIYSQVLEFDGNVTMTYTLTDPNNVSNTITPIISGQNITIPGSSIPELGEYTLTAEITGGLMDGSVYNETFQVVNELVSDESAVNDTSTLPNTGSDEIIAYMSLLSASTIFFIRKSL